MARTDRRTALGLALMALALSCRERPSAPDPQYVAEIEKWRSERLARLTSETGWLTLVGIHWLHPGSNRFGSASDNDITLSGDGVPAHAGTLELKADGTVALHAEPEATITTGGAKVTETTLHSDRAGSPDVLTVGGLRMHVIERSGKAALRVRDPASPRRSSFKGIDYFPIDPTFKVTATLAPYARPREVSVPSAQGPAQTMLAPGILKFYIGGEEHRLEPFMASPDDRELFIVFSDATSGHETYGAGRFLDTPAPEAGSTSVALDFNTAYNPPCAFTPFATCPLPPPGNVLAVSIAAGEKAPAGH